MPIRPFSDWKKTWMPGRHVVRDQGRDADAEIDEHARTQFLRDARAMMVCASMASHPIAQ